MELGHARTAFGGGRRNLEGGSEMGKGRWSMVDSRES
jgi:hypothetical protein